MTHRPATTGDDLGCFEPLVEELHPAPEPEAAFLWLCRLPHCLFLDSVLRHPQLGRYSFLTADPFDYFELPADGSDGLGQLAQRVDGMDAARVPDLPPFQGGAAGLFSYDLGRSLEQVPRPRFDEFAAPAMAIGLYDVVLAFDHVDGRAWIVSQGLPEVETVPRRARAADRLEQMNAWLNRPARDAAGQHVWRQSSLESVAADQLAPDFPVSGPPGLTSNFTAEGYHQAIRRAIEYIRAGDIFQVNLTQRLLYPAHDDSVALYLRLRQRNPATFASFFDLGDFQIVSASPERFLRVLDGQIEARPIKGTRARTAWPEADLFVGDDLRQSEKDRAENVMIVDLLRNDISRVAKPDSVRVTQLCELEAYQYVHHLVSAVVGQLADNCTPSDVVRAAFPGGSITGAPKIRAMQIIAELEPTARGPYCGSLGYLGFDGSLDLSILIRTITAGRGWWQLPVGGGIVSQSVPRREYEETWHKAEGLVRALR